MVQFTTLTAQAMPLPIDNIDTDQIIPARFLKVTDKQGLGQVLFCDWRYTDTVPHVDAAQQAQPDPDFVLNDPRYQHAQILIAGSNFGCGSSREHAPWALLAYGFRAVITPSFADIFRSNALKNGLLPVAVDAQTCARLVELPTEAQLVIDLQAQTLEVPAGDPVAFSIDPFAKRCLLQGVDQLGYLRSFEDEIRAYEKERAYVLAT